MSLEFEGELRIELATDEDWEEIMPGFVEGTLLALGPSEREDLGSKKAQEDQKARVGQRSLVCRSLRGPHKHPHLKGAHWAPRCKKGCLPLWLFEWVWPWG